MSPRPQSSATSLTSPLPNTADTDVIKHQDPCDGVLSSESAPASASSQHLQSNDTATFEREVDTPDIQMHEGGVCSPSITPEYSSKRVSVSLLIMAFDLETALITL